LLPLSCSEPVSSDAEVFIGPSGHPSQQGYIKHVVALNETFAISAADDSIGWLVGGLPARARSVDGTPPLSASQTKFKYLMDTESQIDIIVVVLHFQVASELQ
jgi:hypothetical protein